MCKCTGRDNPKNKLKIPDNITIRYNNPERKEREFVYIDKCLVDEVKGLWKLGIITTGCCCGHNIREGYIGVSDKDIPTMKKLGYEVVYNPFRPKSEDSFKPKYTQQL